MNELKAGRELDALVAEKVMGWTIQTRMQMSDNTYLGFNEWFPSTNIKAAFDVVDEMRKHGKSFSLRRYTSDEFWSCSFGIYCALDETPSLAICRAALRAVM